MTSTQDRIDQEQIEQELNRTEEANSRSIDVINIGQSPAADFDDITAATKPSALSNAVKQTSAVAESPCAEFLEADKLTNAMYIEITDPKQTENIVWEKVENTFKNMKQHDFVSDQKNFDAHSIMYMMNTYMLARTRLCRIKQSDNEQGKLYLELRKLEGDGFTFVDEYGESLKTLLSPTAKQAEQTTNLENLLNFIDVSEPSAKKLVESWIDDLKCKIVTVGEATGGDTKRVYDKQRVFAALSSLGWNCRNEENKNFFLDTKYQGRSEEYTQPTGEPSNEDIFEEVEDEKIETDLTTEVETRELLFDPERATFAEVILRRTIQLLGEFKHFLPLQYFGAVCLNEFVNENTKLDFYELEAVMNIILEFSNTDKKFTKAAKKQKVDSLNIRSIPRSREVVRLLLQFLSQLSPDRIGESSVKNENSRMKVSIRELTSTKRDLSFACSKEEIKTAQKAVTKDIWK